MNPGSPDNNSPFTPPQAPLSTQSTNEYDSSSPYSAQGRFGRIDFIVYSLGMGLVLMLIYGGIAGVMAAASMPPTFAGLAAVVITLPALYFSIIFIIRRLHDMNLSGWLSLLYFVPVINSLFSLILLLWPGKPEPNQYGNPRKPPSKTATAIALIVPVIAIVGILAAIAIPAYQEYVIRAQGG